jgi:hypothetical protein
MTETGSRTKTTNLFRDFWSKEFMTITTALYGAFVSLLAIVPAFASAGIQFAIPTTPVAPVIDGDLSDGAWEGAKLKTDDWVTYNPVRGEILSQRTEVWMTYDSRNLYIAFRCFDPEPDKLKTSISRRDSIFRDDWVGLSLDSMFNGQTSYDMFVNPSGVQADILTSSSSGEALSPDWVWESAGKITSEGYNVEIRLPLQSVRFKSGSEVRMGVLFWRRISRLGSSVSWPAIPSGKRVFECHATALLGELKQPLTFELIPSFTYSAGQDLESPGRWGKVDSKPDTGVTVKYGITSSLTAEATFNPDFSQVESDAFQVTVNQRYPIFFSEKRPFFMEGMGIFSMAGSTYDGNMYTTVHTRRIIDPQWGLKLTGTAGRLSFGSLSAADQATGRRLEGEENTLAGKSRYYNVARAMYSLGKGTYVGGMVTDTQLGNESNRVAGSDLSIRIGEHQSAGGTFLSSETRPQEGDRRSGKSAQATYGYHSDRVNVFSQLEHYDRDFQMDTAFYRRTGITNGWLYSDYSFYPDKEKYPWIRRISPLFFGRHGLDRQAGGHESMALMGMAFRFTRQGFVRVDYAQAREPWAGRVFDADWFRILGNGQVTRWLSAFAYLHKGDGIFYDPEEPYQGKRRSHETGLTFQPTPRISQSVSWNHVNFDHRETGANVYKVDVLNTRTSYQFNRNLSLRAILQYDSSRHRVLTDFLGSYELMPGTVAFIGYGSLFHKQSWHGDRWHGGEGDYLTTRRGVFFKVSYLQRF